MRARATCAALVAAVGIPLLGCYESHRLGTGGDDAGVRIDATPGVDAGPPVVDSGPPVVDAGPPPRLCRMTGPARIDGETPLPDLDALRFSVVNLEGVAHGCSTTFTFVLGPDEVVDPLDPPAPRIELEATIETDLLAEPFAGRVDGVARAFGRTGALADETDATLGIEATPIDFGPGGRIEGMASLTFGVPAWSAMGNAEAPYCFASICL